MLIQACKLLGLNEATTTEALLWQDSIVGGEKIRKPYLCERYADAIRIELDALVSIQWYPQKLGIHVLRTGSAEDRPRCPEQFEVLNFANL